MNDMVSWKDYAGLEGFGNMSGEEVSDLRKALTAGQDINAPGVAAGEGFPLRVESLENTLKVITYKMDDVRLWQAVTKLPAFNTVEEYNRLESYGSGVAAFISEGDLPSSDDSTYRRQYAVIKYVGTTRAVTHVMSLIRPAHGNVIAQETVNGMAWLLKQIERAMFFGDSSMIPVQWDGLLKLITDGAPNPTLNIIDLRGKPLTEDILNDGCLVVKTEPNFGRATDLYCADGAFSDLAKQFYPAERVNLPPAGWQQGMVGLNIQGFYSQFGPIKFNPDLFIQFGPLVGTGAIGATGVPSAPTESVAPAAAPTAGSLFTASDAGDYIYQVRAINRYGKSAPVTMTTLVGLASGDGVTMTVADGATAGTAFDVYRTNAGGAAATARYMKTVARSGATTAITDLNADIPGTSQAFLIQQNLEYFSFKQLAPAVKIPLATIDTSIRWMQLLYGAPVVYAPGKSVIYKNVGRAVGSSGLDNALIP
jgi:hypothetical protein